MKTVTANAIGFAAFLATSEVYGHGHMTFPASTRHGGSLSLGGDCTNQACYWFSNNVEIPGEETLPNDMRTINRNVTGHTDVFKTSPWRAPGSAPVFGSGCGVGGGSSKAYLNGGFIKSHPQGMDGKDLPAVGQPAVWRRGSKATVGWAISANHGGGYSYRLCPADGEISEECFQQHPLRFANSRPWIEHPDGSKKYFKRQVISTGTVPEGSQWSINPIPGCKTCDAFSSCGAPKAPVSGFMSQAAKEWDDQVNCYAACDGSTSSKAGGVCPSQTQFPPLAGDEYSGFGKYNWDWSIMDEVEVPSDLPAGKYLLSWRWDCEESTQVWQNCADITIE